MQFSPPLRTTVTRARVVLGTGGEKGSEEPGKAWGGVVINHSINTCTEGLPIPDTG